MSVASVLWHRRGYAAGLVFRKPLRVWRTYRRLVHESVTGHYRPHGDPASADCAIAFCSSDQANKDLAWVYLPALRAKRPELPFILSPEIYDLYTRDLCGDPDRASSEPLFRLDRSEGTHESAREAHTLMRKEGLERPLLLALDLHLPRMDAAIQWFNSHTIVPDDLQSIRLSTTDTSHMRRWRRKQPGVVAFYILAGYVLLDE